MHMVAQHRAERQLVLEQMAVLHFGEDRRFRQPAAQVNGKQPENTTDEERNAPRKGGQFFRRENPVDGSRDQRADHDAERQARAEEPARHADAIGRNVFGHEGPCTRHFAANGSALQHAEDDQQDRRTDAQRRIGRQAGHGQRRDGHEKDGEGEDALAAKLVAEMRQHDAAHGAHQIAGCENAEGLNHHQPVRHVGRKEQMADDAGEEHEDDEIIKLQRAAKGRKAERAEILPVKRTRTIACVEIRRCHRFALF